MGDKLKQIATRITSKGFSHDIPKPIASIEFYISEIELAIKRDSNFFSEAAKHFSSIRTAANSLEDAIGEAESLDNTSSSDEELITIVNCKIRPNHELYTGEVESFLRGIRIDHELSKGFQNDLEKIHQGLTRLNRMLFGLINLLDVKQELKIMQTDISRHVKRVMSQIVDSDPEAYFKTRIEGLNSLTVEAKWEDLQNILYNIIENAKRYAKKSQEEGYIIITQRAFVYESLRKRFTLPAEYASSEAWALVTFRNSYTESKPIALHKIFELYFSTVEPDMSESGGTGIGLAIVKLTILKNGGFVTADSGYDLVWVSHDSDVDQDLKSYDSEDTIYLIRRKNGFFIKVINGSGAKKRILLIKDSQFIEAADLIQDLKEKIDKINLWYAKNIPHNQRLELLSRIDKILRTDKRFRAYEAAFRLHLMWPREKKNALNLDDIVELEYPAALI